MSTHKQFFITLLIIMLILMMKKLGLRELKWFDSWFIRIQEGATVQTSQ